MTQTILACAIAGVSHAKPDFDSLNAEDEVILIHEKTNEFDRKAILVLHPVAGKLGYVPRESTICIHDAWRNGLFTQARIVSFDDSGRVPKIILHVTVTL